MNTKDFAVGYAAGKGSVSLVPKSVTANGAYDPADDGADGYSGVEVNVASGGGFSNPGVILELIVGVPTQIEVI